MKDLSYIAAAVNRCKLFSIKYPVNATSIVAPNLVAHDCEIKADLIVVENLRLANVILKCKLLIVAESAIVDMNSELTIDSSLVKTNSSVEFDTIKYRPESEEFATTLRKYFGDEWHRGDEVHIDIPVEKILNSVDLTSLNEAGIDAFKILGIDSKSDDSAESVDSCGKFDNIPSSQDDILKTMKDIAYYDTIAGPEGDDPLTLTEKQRLYSLPKNLVKELGDSIDGIIRVVENSAPSGKRWFTKLHEAWNNASNQKPATSKKKEAKQEEASDSTDKVEIK